MRLKFHAGILFLFAAGILKAAQVAHASNPDATQLVHTLDGQ